jgi:ribose 5-phosphate isomerase RpiB
MPLLRKTININVSGNNLVATDSVSGLATTDAGVEGEDGAISFHVIVPADWQDISTRLQIISLNGGYDESGLAVGGIIDMPLRQALTESGTLTLRLVGSTASGLRKSADLKTLQIQKSDVETDLIDQNYPYPIHNITGSGAALVTQTDNDTWNVAVSGAGGGDMLVANYANGAGAANTNKVDNSIHAVSADNATNASAAAPGSALATQIAAITTLPSWTAPILLNSWVNYGGSNAAAGYYKDSLNRAQLRGFIKSGTVGAIIFNLSAGYRPSVNMNFGALSSNGSLILAYIEVYTSGDVVLVSGGNTYLSLDGISFRAQQ